MKTPLLEVKKLQISFQMEQEKKTIVDRISFHVDEGEILGIVGESGSGKSMTALSILGLLKKEAMVDQGKILFEGEDLLTLDTESFRQKKGSEISMIFQEPMTSLNPVIKIGKQVEEMIRLHKDGTEDEMKERALAALSDAGFETPEEIYQKYPHQLSGGMRQRVMIAIACVNHPKLLIADEPTTALDVTVQARILELIRSLNRKYNMAVIFVSHDLGVIHDLCDRAIVMCDGAVVEEGTVNELFYAPKEEYTKKLIEAIPKRREDSQNGQKSNELQREQIVLSVDHLNTFYDDRKNRLFHQNKEEINQVIHDISFELHKGEILGIVGESGCGKTTLVKSILGMIATESGSINTYQNKIQLVFQDPYNSLNPMKKVGWLMEEPLKMKTKLKKDERRAEVEQMIEKVGLKKEYLDRYPSDLSGGQRQRIAIAMALITKPEIVILDEPVSALDVTVQAQILEMLVHLRKEFQLSYIFISHDLNVVAQICDRTLVLYQGRIVEEGTIDQIFDTPKDKYTQRLLQNKIDWDCK